MNASGKNTQATGKRIGAEESQESGTDEEIKKEHTGNRETDQ